MSRAGHRLAALLVAGLALTLAGATGTALIAAPASAAPSVPPPSTGPPASPTPSPGSTNAGPPSSLAITLTSLTPTVVTPTSTLRIRGRITNTGTAVVQNGTVRLLVHHSPLVSRSLVALWGAGDIDDVGGRILGASADLTVDLAPGASAPFTITAPAPQLGLQMAYASIGITLEALGDDGTDLGTHRLGLLRSYLTWQAKAAYQPLQLTWLMPLTGEPVSPTGGPPSTAALAAAVGPQSRLADVLAAIRAAPAGAALSVAADPALVADLTTASTAAGAGAGQGSAVSPTSKSPSTSTSTATGTGTPTGSPTVPAPTPRDVVSSYLTSLKTALAGRQLVQLPYADPDLIGVADNQGGSLLTAAMAAAGTGSTSILAKDLGSTPMTDLAWPASGWADPATLSAAKKIGQSTSVLAASSRPPELEQTSTPSSYAPLSSSTSAVLYDDVLSSMLAHANNPATTVLTVQRFLAETLATVGERPGRTRILLVAAPRSFDPSPTVVQRLFSAIGSAPWIQPATMASLRAGHGQDEVSVRSAAPIPTSVRRGQLSATQITAVRDVRAQAADLSAVIDGDNALAPIQLNALRLLSTSLRGHSGTAAAGTKALKASLTALGAKVHILPLSNLNFLASDGNLTLSVANDLNQDVHNLRVQVQPGNGRLVVVKQAAPIGVDAQRRTTIKVHVHAVAGGVVPVTARIVTPSGLALGKTVTVTVHVRPTDTWAFWVLGVAAGLVFVIGLWRTLRRGRSRPRLQAPEVEDL